MNKKKTKKTKNKNKKKTKKIKNKNAYECRIDLQ